MAGFNNILQDQGKLLEVTQNEYGEQVKTTETDIYLRFRYVTQIDKNNGGEGLDTVDAIIWLDADTTAIEGSIILFDGKYWRIERLIKARRLREGATIFVKCFVKAHDLVEIS